MKSSRILGLTLLICSFAEAANAYDITDAINSSLQNNMQLKNSLIQLQAANLNRSAAVTEFLPQVVAQASDYKTISRGVFQKSGVQRQDQIGISQEIFSGGRGLYNLNASKYISEAAAIQYQSSIDNIIIQTVQVYESVIASREAYNVTLQNVESLKKIEKQSEIKLSVGTITKTNMLEAKARLASAMSEKERAYSDMKNSEENFKYVTGEEAPVQMSEIDISSIALPKDLDVFLETVAQNNQSILASEKNLQAKKFATRSTKTTLLPTVSASAALFKQGAWNPIFMNTSVWREFSGGNYQVSVTLPIFQNGKEYVNIRKAQLEEEAASNNRDDTIMKAHKDAASAWHQYNQAKISIESDADSVNYYKEFARGADEEFNMGTKTLTDLLQAQVQYENARTKLIQDKANMIISALNIKFLLGELNKVDFSRLVVKNEALREKKIKSSADISLSDEKMKKISEISTT